MTNVTNLFQDSERLHSQDALKSAIRQQLAAAIGILQREQTAEDILFVLRLMEEAANLVRVMYEMRNLKEDVRV
jgi:Flp pilus assembly protein TadD